MIETFIARADVLNPKVVMKLDAFMLKLIIFTMLPNFLVHVVLNPFESR